MLENAVEQLENEQHVAAKPTTDYLQFSFEQGIWSVLLDMLMEKKHFGEKPAVVAWPIFWPAIIAREKTCRLTQKCFGAPTTHIPAKTHTIHRLRLHRSLGLCGQH